MEQASSWKNKQVVESFLTGRRSAIPYAGDHLLMMMQLLLHMERPLNSFVDLGAGDGILSQLILEQFKDSKGFLVDFSGPMIDAAYRRLTNYPGRFEIFNGDLAAPAWQKTVFKEGLGNVDAIVSGYCIHHLTHGRKFELYQEIYQHLADHGIFINIEHVASKSSWGEMVSDQLFIDSMVKFETESAVPSAVPSADPSAHLSDHPRTREEISKDYHNRPDKKDNMLLSPEIQCEWLREIGFQRVDIYFKCFELAVFAGQKIMK